MTQIAFLFAEIATLEGHQGVGYSYSKRAGGPGQYAHAKEIAEEVIGEDPNDIQRIWTKLVWAGASSAGAAWLPRPSPPSILRSGTSRPSEPGFRSRNCSGLPRFGGLLQHLRRLPVLLDRGDHRQRERLDRAWDRRVKIKVGQPDPRIDLNRVERYVPR